MAWGAFCSDAMFDLAFPSTTVNSGEYIDILNEKLMPFLEAQAEKTFIYQQDNASVHKRRQTMEWLKSNNIEVIDWPACSPDQNPIKNIWGILVRRVYAQNRQYRDVFELKEIIIDEWRAITEDTRTKLVQSMPD